MKYSNRHSDFFGKVIDCDEEEETQHEQLLDLNSFLEGDC